MGGPAQDSSIRHLPLPPSANPGADPGANPSSAERTQLPTPFVEIGEVKISVQGLEMGKLNAHPIEGGGVSFNVNGLDFTVNADTEAIGFKDIGNGKIQVDVADKPVDGVVLKQSLIIDILGQASDTKQWSETQSSSAEKSAPAATLESIESEMQQLKEREAELLQQRRELEETKLKQERNGILNDITGEKGWSVGAPDSELGIIRSKETVGIYNPQGKCIGNVSADESLTRMSADTFETKAKALINK